MKRNAFLTLCVAALVCTGCDWVRTTLGLKSKAELAALQEEMAAKEAAEQKRIADSIAMAEALKLEQQRMPQEEDCITSLEPGSFYLILGSLKEQVNVENLKMYIRKAGFTPVVVPSESGNLTLVGLGPYKSRSHVKDLYCTLPEYLIYDSGEEWIMQAK